MISSLSKYFYNHSELNDSNESSKYSQEQKTMNLESIKTNNILKTLRKLDSSENILNLVQITEYKKTPRKESARQSKNKSKVNKNTDDFEKVKDNTAKSIITSIDSRASQQSLTKVSRKEKAEDINLLGILSKHDDRESSYESVMSDKNWGKKSIEKLIMSDLVITNEKSHTEQKGNPEDGEQKHTNVEHKDLENDQRETFLIQPSKSRIEVKNSKSISKIDNDQTQLWGSKTDLLKTKSSVTLKKPTSNSVCEFEHRADLSTKCPEHEPCTDETSTSRIDSKSSRDIIQKNSSRINSKENIPLAQVNVTERNISTLEKTQSQNNLIIRNLMKDCSSEEKIINQVYLDCSDAQKRDDSEETAILFTRNSCSNDSICSKSSKTFEVSKIPVLTRLDHVLSHNTPSLEKTKQAMKKTFDQSLEDEEKSFSENTPIIQSVVRKNSKDMRESESDVVHKNTFKTINPMPTFKETFGHAVKIVPSKDIIDKIVKTVEQPAVTKQSKKNVPTKTDVQKQVRTGTRSKVSIFNSGTGTEKSQKNTFPIYPKRKFARPKETMSRTPLTLVNSHSTYKSNTSSISQTKQTNYLQKNGINISQKSRTNSIFFKKPDSIESNKRIKSKLSTVKNAKSLKSTEIKTSPTRKNISLSKVKSKTEIMIEKQNDEKNIHGEINKCKALKEEIMQKIETYEQSMKNAYQIKNELISNSTGSCKVSLDEFFINDETINMISQVNAVEHMRLKNEFLAKSNAFVKKVTDKVTVELRKYHDFVQDSINELHKKHTTPAENHKGRKDIEDIMKHTSEKLELRSKEIADITIQALGNIAAENQSLNNYCKEIIKTNDDCNEKLMEKLAWLEKENENLSTQIFSLKRGSISNKTLLDDLMESKKKDDQFSEILKIYNDIEMKNKYHAQLVENFMKSVKMIENKIENHSRLVESKVEKTTSQVEIAEKKRHAMEETIERLKERLENNRQEYQELISKQKDFQKTILRLKNKNKILTKELLRYKYPIHLEKNIQKMITLRNMLVDIVHNNDSDSPPPLQDKQLLDIMHSIDNEVFFPMLDPPVIHSDENNNKVQKKDSNDNVSTPVRDHGESMSNVDMDDKNS